MFGGTTTNFFASTAKPTTTTPAFSFGSTAAKPLGSSTAGTGLSFGGTTQNKPLFGNTPTSTGGLLGGAPTTSFGGGFGTTTSSMFGSQLQQPQQQTPEFMLRLRALSDAYDIQNQSYPFRFMFYNHLQNASQYKRPLDVHPKLWQQAVAANPDPEKLVPVEAKGFQALKQRIQAQNDATDAQVKKLNEIEGALTTVEQKHQVSNLSQLEQYKRRHCELYRRTLQLMRQLELLAARGSGVSRDDELLSQRLGNALNALARPDQFRGRLAVLNADLRSAPTSMSTASSSMALDSLPTESVDDLCYALAQMQEGIRVLNATLQKDLDDLRIIQNGIKQ